MMSLRNGEGPWTDHGAPGDALGHGKLACAVLAWVTVFALASPGYAATRNWFNAAGGPFNTPANWSPAIVPGSSSTAIFNLISAYTVQFEFGFTTKTNLNFEVKSGFVTFDLFFDDPASFEFDRAYHYTLNVTGGAAAHIGSAPGSFFAAKLILDGGVGGGLSDGLSTITTSSNLEIGRDDGSAGILEMNLTEWISNSPTVVGRDGTGTLQINDDSKMTNNIAWIGFGDGSSGTVTLDGVGFDHPVWENTNALVVGLFGDGSLDVNKGTVTSQDTFVAAQPGSTGDVTVNSGGNLETTQSMYVGGGSVSPGGMGTVTQNGGNIDVDVNLTVRAPGTVNINGGTLDVANNLALDPGSTFNFSGGNTRVGDLTGDSGGWNWTAGNLTVDATHVSIDTGVFLGSNLTLDNTKDLSVPNDALLIGPTGAGDLVVMAGGKVTSQSGVVGSTDPASTAALMTLTGSGATWTVTNDLHVRGANSAELSVLDGASVSNDNAFIASLAASTADVQVNQTGATWDSAGSVYLGGDATTLGGNGTLDVLDGGAMTVAGTMKVWDNYTLNVDGGTLTTPELEVAGTANFPGQSLDLTGPGLITSLNLIGGTVTAASFDLGADPFTGFGTLAGEVKASGPITPTGDLTLGDPGSFTALDLTGPLVVGAHTVTLHKAGFFILGASTTITGGTLNVPNGIAVLVGNSLVAAGAVTGRIFAQGGSTIVATGDLSLGDGGSVAGFFSDGELVVGDKTVHILDANVGVLGSLTTLGDAGAPGTLVAANGLVVEFGKNVTGFGTIDTPNDAARPLINNGFIGGDSVTEPVTLNGFVKGVGTFANIVINGTLSPGLSPGHIQVDGDLVLGDSAMLVMELAGLAPSTQHDRLDIAGDFGANGTLQVLLIGGFTPQAGDTFGLFGFAGVDGAFDRVDLPTLGGGLSFDTSSLLTTGALSVVPEPTTVVLLSMIAMRCACVRRRLTHGT